MPLKVVCFARYLSGSGVKWRPCDHDVHKFIQALKGDTINKYAKVPIRGKKLGLSNANAADAIKWFGQMASDYLKGTSIKPPLYFVPIPNSTSLKTSPHQPRTALLASSLATEFGAGEVLDVLRCEKELVSARKGGPRDAVSLYRNLVLKGKIPPKAQIVFVDDVMTLGGHLQAGRTLVEEHGAVVKLAICAGRTVLEPTAECFEVIELEIDDFRP